MIRKTALLIVSVVIALTGCVRRDGRNSDCKWPGESEAKKLIAGQPDYESHLMADAEFAEELAIRYMDGRRGPRSETAGEAENRCLGVLFGEIGKAHEVPAVEVFRFLGRRRMEVDVALNLPFLLLYGLAAWMMVRHLRGRYPIADGWMTVVLVVLLSSLAFAAAGVALGEQWSTAAENVRVGNGHLSIRMARLPWGRHRSGLFALGVVIFWLLAAIGYRGSLRPVQPRQQIGLV